LNLRLKKVERLLVDGHSTQQKILPKTFQRIDQIEIIFGWLKKPIILLMLKPTNGMKKPFEYQNDKQKKKSLVLCRFGSD